MAVKIADTIKAMGNFPIAECVDINVNINGESKRLQKAIDDGEIGGGDLTWKGTHEEWEALSTEEKGKYEVICFTDDYDDSGIGESDSSWKGTRDEWEALSTAEKQKYVIVYFTDDYDAADSTGLIDDTNTSGKTTYSSTKIENSLSKKANTTDLTVHTSDTNIHVSTSDKTKWNNSVNKTDIVDNLTSTNTDKPLSANQGKVLKDEIGLKANTTDLTAHTGNTGIHVTTSDKTKWNKVDNKIDKTDIVDNLTSTNTDKPLSAKQGKVLKDDIGLKANETEVIKKTAITTIINSASTDSQVPSAKSVYNNAIKYNNIKTYYTLAQLGITSATCTIKDIWDKMPANSIGVIDTNSSIVTDLGVFKTAFNLSDDQSVYGFLTIGKFTERTILEFRRSHAESAIIPETFIGYCIGKNCTSIDWKRIIISSIESNYGSVTAITFSDTTNYKQQSNIGLKYYNLNGVCYISGGVDCVKPSSSLVKLATISKPRFSYVYAKGIVVNGSAADNTHLTICIDGSGNLQLQNGLAGESYRFTFSYPIA